MLECCFFSDRVYFIDYEYAMFNCEHYETAHHFCYMAGMFWPEAIILFCAKLS